MPHIEFSEREVDIVANNIEKSNISLVQRAASMLKSLNRERQYSVNQSAEQRAKILSLEAQLKERDNLVKTSIDSIILLSVDCILQNFTKITSEIELLIENFASENDSIKSDTALACLKIIKDNTPDPNWKNISQTSILTKIISEIEALENTFQEKYGESISTATCIYIIRSYLPKQEDKSDERQS